VPPKSDETNLLEKLKKAKVKNLNQIKEKFEQKYEEAVNNAPFEEKVIKGDISYNLGILPEFKDAAIHEYHNTTYE